MTYNDTNIPVVLFTDLDNTLTFSARAIREEGLNPEDLPLIEVEHTIKNNHTSYIHQILGKGLDSLIKQRLLVVVPVTSRSQDQVERMNLPFYYDYAIVNNSGTLLAHTPDTKRDASLGIAYHDEIEKIRATFVHIPFEEYADQVATIDGKRPEIFGHVLSLVIRDLELTTEQIQQLKTFADSNDLTFSKQGVKILFGSKILTKANGIKFIRENIYPKSYTVSAGDSTLDVAMETVTDEFISLLDTENQQLYPPTGKRTQLKNTGVVGSLEILSILQQRCHSEK